MLKVSKVGESNCQGQDAAEAEAEVATLAALGIAMGTEIVMVTGGIEACVAIRGKRL